MFTQYLRYGCLFIALFLSISIVKADIFRWQDDNLITQYTQYPPHDRPYEHIALKVSKPDTDPKVAQQEIDDLIKQLDEEDKRLDKNNKEIDTEEEQQKIIENNCQIAQDNLIAYQNNPGRRMTDEEGNVTRPTEEERQQKIQEAKDNIDKYCK